MAYIYFDFSKTNHIDQNVLRAFKRPSEFKDLEIETENGHITDISLDEYYVEDDYDDVKDLAVQFSKLLLNGTIVIEVTESEDDYKFIIEPNKVSFFIKTCKYIEINTF